MMKKAKPISHTVFSHPVCPPAAKHETGPRENGVVDRRSFLRGLGLAGATLVPASTLLITKGTGSAQTLASGYTQGDVDILRFLTAIEILETDLWLQYRELALNNPAYTAALTNITVNALQYIVDNSEDEDSHSKFLNAFLASIGADPVSLDAFRTLPSSQAKGANQIGRLTKLTQLNVDTGWYTWYRSPNNPDFGDTFKGPLTIKNQPAIPLNDTDTPPTTALKPPIVSPQARRTQAIANTAAFHFATIERVNASLYSSLIPSATSPVVLRILAAIGGSEIAHFQTWHDKAGNTVSKPLAGVTDPVTRVTFPDLNSPAAGGEFSFQTNLIMPKPCSFISKDLPSCSIIRPTLQNDAGPIAAVNILTEMGLFGGQSSAFFSTLQALANAAEKSGSAVGAGV